MNKVFLDLTPRAKRRKVTNLVVLSNFLSLNGAKKDMDLIATSLRAQGHTVV